MYLLLYKIKLVELNISYILYDIHIPIYVNVNLFNFISNCKYFNIEIYKDKYITR